MSRWLDSWARRAAEGTPTAAPDAVAPARPASPSSRRDFLKKAGIVGGVAWSVPVLQTVMAPAASASAGTALGNNCPAGNVACQGGAFCAPTAPFRCGGLGATCGACAAGAGTCSNATCGGGGGTCTPANQATTCVSGICIGTTCRALVGAACGTNNANCFSGRCVSGVCTKASAGGGCLANVDCQTGSCNTGTKTCNQAALGGGCWVNGDCANSGGSNINCSPASGFARPNTCGGQGAVCGGTNDCSAGSGNRCTGNNPSTCKA